MHAIERLLLVNESLCWTSTRKKYLFFFLRDEIVIINVLYYRNDLYNNIDSITKITFCVKKSTDSVNSVAYA